MFNLMASVPPICFPLPRIVLLRIFCAALVLVFAPSEWLNKARFHWFAFMEFFLAGRADFLLRVILI